MKMITSELNKNQNKKKFVNENNTGKHSLSQYMV